MKEIQILSSGTIQKIEVDDSKVDFKGNNYALVEGIITKKNRNGKTITYSKQGVITEDYEELLPSEEERANSLHFLGRANEIIQYSDCDFIAKINEDNPKAPYGHYYHIRVLDNKPILINSFGGTLTKTKQQGILIINDKRVYDVRKGEFVTRSYHKISEKKNTKELVFCVEDIICASDVANGIYPTEIEKIYFQINVKDTRVSLILSDLEKRFFNEDEVHPDYETFLLLRKENLLARKKETENELPETPEGLKRKLEQPKDYWLY